MWLYVSISSMVLWPFMDMLVIALYGYVAHLGWYFAVLGSKLNEKKIS